MDEWSDITSLYKAIYGEPRPGAKVFLITCQQKEGWKARDWETSAIVPKPTDAQEAASEGAKRGATLPSETRASGLPAHLTRVVGKPLERLSEGVGAAKGPVKTARWGGSRAGG